MQGKTRLKLQKEITQSELYAILGARSELDLAPIRCLSTDSRLCMPGDLFISLAKDISHSRSHICEARSRGAITLGIGGAEITADPIDALLAIARYEKSALNGLKHTVAITGSVGKTTTKEFLKSILSVRYRCHATQGNKNNEIGLPLTMLSAPEDTEILVLECGMNHRGEIARLSTASEPDIAIITNIGSAHIGNLGSREQIAMAKLEILHGMPKGGILIREADEPLLGGISSGVTFSVICRDSGTSGDNGAKGASITDGHIGDLPDRRYILYPDNCGAELFINGSPYTRLDFRLPKHLLANLAAAVTAAHLCGLDADEIALGVSRISDGNMRHTLIKRRYYTLLSDAYNASYESVVAALGLLMSSSAEIRSALLGDILELGEYGESIHRALGAHIAKLGPDKLYLVGKYASCTMSGAVGGGMAKEKIFIIDADNLPEIARIIKSKLSEGECMLIKASHACGLWQIPELLDGEDNDRY